MKYIISLNYKFFSKSANDLYDLIKKDIDGFEIYLRDEKDFYYLEELYKIAKDKIINIHGNIEMDLDYQYKLLDYLSKFRHTNIVLHSKNYIKKSKSIKETIEIINKLYYYIKENKYDITLSLENLNNIALLKRLNKEEITPILKELDFLYFTYDIGHEIIENGNISDLLPIHLNRINNIHLHTYKNFIDHEPIYSIDEEMREIIDYLINIKYDKTLVFEYDFNRCRGIKYEDRIKDYLNSINFFRKEYEYARKIKRKS